MNLPTSIKETDILIMDAVARLNKVKGDTDAAFLLDDEIRRLRSHRIELERERIVNNDRMK